MLLTSDLAASELFRLVKAGELPHPTSAGFDPLPWIEALDAIEVKTPRDYRLATSAIYYGGEIRSLRASQAEKLVHGMSRSGGLRLLAATANQQYLTLMGKLNAVTKAKGKEGPLHLEQLDQSPITNLGGQAMTADDHSTHLVDTLPHWLHHIMALPEDGTCRTPDQPDQSAGRAIAIASIERGLRDLWQEALWTGHWLGKEEDEILHQPLDLPTGERWTIWELRQQALLSQEMFIDLGAHIIAGRKLPPAAPVLKRTVTRIARRRDGRRRFHLGPVSGRKPADRLRVSENDALGRLYTGLFLEEALPKLGAADINCRLLNQAWWLMADLVRLIAEEAGEPWFEDDRGIGRFAFAIAPEELRILVADALEISEERAGGIVDFLTVDPTDTKALFGRGFWPAPLLPDAARGRLYLIAAPLLIGSPLRRVEAWLERGGLTDRAGIRGRGKPFEEWVRRAVADALAGNGLLPDHAVAEHALKRKGSSEEIDLLVRIGGTLLVGEVKCFVFPSEPLERFNYLKNVESAARQARDKAAWAERNRAQVGAQVGVNDAAAAEALRIVPLVVTNHGLCLGLEIDGAIVTDLHYLQLMMGAGHYQADTMFKRDLGSFQQSVILYSDQADFERRVGELFAAPPPLKRYQGKIEWRRVPFVTSDDRPFSLLLPSLSGPPMNAAALKHLEQFADDWERTAVTA